MERLVYREKHGAKFFGILIDADGVEMGHCGNCDTEEQANEILDKILETLESPPESYQDNAPTLGELAAKSGEAAVEEPVVVIEEPEDVLDGDNSEDSEV